MRNTLELVEVDSDRLEEVLRRAEQALDEKDAELIRAVFDSYAYVTELVEDKNTSIRRLRQLLFGSRTEKTGSVVGQKNKTPDATPPRDAVADTDLAGGAECTDESGATVVSKGHGRNGAAARERRLSPEARLRFHQEASGPTMESLHDWLERQLGEKRTEPNSALGGAIGYTLKHWDELTLFLRQASAPLYNNLCERALKKAILHRKNALFYKTRNGLGLAICS